MKPFLVGAPRALDWVKLRCTWVGLLSRAGRNRPERLQFSASRSSSAARLASAFAAAAAAGFRLQRCWPQLAQRFVLSAVPARSSPRQLSPSSFFAQHQQLPQLRAAIHFGAEALLRASSAVAVVAHRLVFKAFHLHLRAHRREHALRPPASATSAPCPNSLPSSGE